ncbi:MAG: DNA mismatch repair endonuclease MutL [Pyrinomonadaceae bacterium MAG19_C2-C3]|nr:DNA mismatch repair endonuclease MutL [Pyrinomonadaceae bacterium MAG19_C2-C3]
MKIRVLSDNLANQIAAGEVVERPSSVVKELVENSLDAGARRIEVTTEAGGRRLLRVLDDGSGMSRDDAILAFERHATSKISTTEDLTRIATLGFRGEALASIAAVARIEMTTFVEGETEATRVVIEGGRLRDVTPGAHPRGTTFLMRDLFFNIPARRKFLRSEATETFHLTNLVTHYALAHPEVEFVLINNGRESLRASPATSLRERAYQIFGAEFVENLLEVEGGHPALVRVRGFTSAPRERRTSPDAQYLFVNGRFIRDRLVRRALMEGYRSVLPHGVYPAALLFLDVPFEEVDVNVHPAKTEVRFRRAAAIADAVRESIRAALARGGYARSNETYSDDEPGETHDAETSLEREATQSSSPASQVEPRDDLSDSRIESDDKARASSVAAPPAGSLAMQPSIGFVPPPTPDDFSLTDSHEQSIRHDVSPSDDASSNRDEHESGSRAPSSIANTSSASEAALSQASVDEIGTSSHDVAARVSTSENLNRQTSSSLPPLDSATHLLRDTSIESLSTNIRPLGQLEESFIIATDDEGLLLLDQHVVHERILFDKYHRMEGERAPESQNLLIPETFDLSPAQAAAFGLVHKELESYGFRLMQLSGRTVAIAATPADLPASEARNLLSEVLDTIDAEKRGAARASLRDRIAASLACRAAIKINTPLSIEKMQWLIDRLLTTSSPTTCPHGRPILLRLTVRDIERAFHRS